MRNDHRRELTPRELQRQRRKDQVQRRRLVAALCLLALIVVIIVLVTTCSGPKNSGTTTTTINGETTSTTLGAASYKADLTGTDAVPPVETSATGTFLMSYDPDTGKLTYSLELETLDNPSAATIYEGAPGDSGTAVYTLYAGPAEKAGYSGILAQGTIDVASFTGPLQGKTLGDLVAMINDGNAYVSVGTTANPIDAIRGQISESSTTSTVSSGSSSSGANDTTTTAKRTTTTRKSTTTTTKKKTTTT